MNGLKEGEHLKTLNDLSTEELITELKKRKGIQLLTAGLYQGWDLKRKYSRQKGELPNQYRLLLITVPAQRDSN